MCLKSIMINLPLYLWMAITLSWVLVLKRVAWPN